MFTLLIREVLIQFRMHPFILVFVLRLNDTIKLVLLRIDLYCPCCQYFQEGFAQLPQGRQRSGTYHGSRSKDVGHEPIHLTSYRMYKLSRGFPYALSGVREIRTDGLQTPVGIFKL